MEENIAHSYDNLVEYLCCFFLSSCADKSKVFNNVYVTWVSIGWIQFILDCIRKEAMWSRGRDAHSHTNNHVRRGAAFWKLPFTQKDFLRFVAIEVSFFSILLS